MILQFRVKYESGVDQLLVSQQRGGNRNGLVVYIHFSLLEQRDYSFFTVVTKL